MVIVGGMKSERGEGDETGQIFEMIFHGRGHCLVFFSPGPADEGGNCKFVEFSIDSNINELSAQKSLAVQTEIGNDIIGRWVVINHKRAPLANAVNIGQNIFFFCRQNEPRGERLEKRPLASASAVLCCCANCNNHRRCCSSEVAPTLNGLLFKSRHTTHIATPFPFSSAPTDQHFQLASVTAAR